MSKSKVSAEELSREVLRAEKMGLDPMVEIERDSLDRPQFRKMTAGEIARGKRYLERTGQRIKYWDKKIENEARARRVKEAADRQANASGAIASVLKAMGK